MAAHADTDKHIASKTKCVMWGHSQSDDMRAKYGPKFALLGEEKAPLLQEDQLQQWRGLDQSGAAQC